MGPVSQGWSVVARLPGPGHPTRASGPTRVGEVEHPASRGAGGIREGLPTRVVVPPRAGSAPHTANSGQAATRVAPVPPGPVAVDKPLPRT